MKLGKGVLLTFPLTNQKTRFKENDEIFDLFIVKQICNMFYIGTLEINVNKSGNKY